MSLSPQLLAWYQEMQKTPEYQGALAYAIRTGSTSHLEALMRYPQMQEGALAYAQRTGSTRFLESLSQWRQSLASYGVAVKTQQREQQAVALFKKGIVDVRLGFSRAEVRGLYQRTPEYQRQYALEQMPDYYVGTKRWKKPLTGGGYVLVEQIYTPQEDYSVKIEETRTTYIPIQQPTQTQQLTQRTQPRVSIPDFTYWGIQKKTTKDLRKAVTGSSEPFSLPKAFLEMGKTVETKYSFFKPAPSYFGGEASKGFYAMAGFTGQFENISNLLSGELDRPYYPSPVGAVVGEVIETATLGTVRTSGLAEYQTMAQRYKGYGSGAFLGELVVAYASGWVLGKAWTGAKVVGGKVLKGAKVVGVKAVHTATRVADPILKTIGGETYLYVKATSPTWMPQITASVKGAGGILSRQVALGTKAMIGTQAYSLLHGVYLANIRSPSVIAKSLGTGLRYYAGFLPSGLLPTPHVPSVITQTRPYMLAKTVYAPNIAHLGRVWQPSLMYYKAKLVPQYGIGLPHLGVTGWAQEQFSTYILDPLKPFYYRIKYRGLISTSQILPSDLMLYEPRKTTTALVTHPTQRLAPYVSRSTPSARAVVKTVVETVSKTTPSIIPDVAGYPILAGVESIVSKKEEWVWQGKPFPSKFQMDRLFTSLRAVKPPPKQRSNLLPQLVPLIEPKARGRQREKPALVPDIIFGQRSDIAGRQRQRTQQRIRQVLEQMQKQVTKTPPRLRLESPKSKTKLKIGKIKPFWLHGKVHPITDPKEVLKAIM